MSAKKKVQDTNDDVETGANLGQVREILFGTQVREFEKRFAKLEQRLDKEMDSLRADTKKRLESLDLFIRSEVAALSDADRAEQQERAAAVKDVAKELKNAGSGLDKKLDKLDGRLTKSERTLNQHMVDQITSLRDELAGKAAALEKLVEQEAAELRDAKTDRAALGALFQEMGLRVTDSLELPDIG